MSKLPEEQRLAIALVLVEGMSYKEAAEVLEIPDGHAHQPARARPHGARRGTCRQGDPP